MPYLKLVIIQIKWSRYISFLGALRARPKRADENGLLEPFFFSTSIYSKVNMLQWYLNENSLHEESEYVIILLIQECNNILVFGTAMVKLCTYI